MVRRVGRLSVPSGATVGTFLLASSLYAQAPPPKPIEVVYSTNSSDDRILRLDFATGTSTVVNTDVRQISRLSGLAVRNDSSAVHLLVCDSVGNAVLFYENAAGAGQPIATEILFPDGVSLDLAGNAYVVTGNVRHEVWKLPRGGSRPGGYGAPVLIDQDLPSTLLEDTRVVPFSAGRLRRGDLLVLSSVPATIFRYPKVDCAADDTACTGFGPREVFVPESAFPEGAKPTGLAFAPSRDLLVSRHVGEILRYEPDGLRVQPDFAVALGEGRFKIAVGVQDGESYAFVVNRSGGGGVQRFLINEDGTGTPDGAVTDKVSNPNGVGLGSGQAAPTPTGAGVVVVPAPEIVLTFDNVVTAGITTARVIEFEDNRGQLHGSFEVDQSLKDFFPEGSPLRNELPDVTMPAYVQAFKKGDPNTGTPTFLLTILDSTAVFSRTVEVRYDEKEQLGYQPSCTDGDSTQQPRTFYVPEGDPPKSEPPIVEGPLFTDFSTGCGSNISAGFRFSLWLTARDTRDLSDVVDFKLQNLSAALDFYPCINPVPKGSLQAELQGAAAAFDAYEETGDAAQQAAAIAHLDAFIGTVDSNPGGFFNCDASVNIGGELIARAESAKFLIAKVVVIPLIVIKHVVNDNGGTAVASDFTIMVTGNKRNSPARYLGDEAPGRMVGLRPGIPGTSGDYFVIELDDQDQDGVTDGPGPPGYRVTLSAGCSGTITTETASVTCEIINDDIPPKLTLVKQVVNNNGGTAAAADFTLSASGLTPTPISGAGGAISDGTFHQGTYTLSETGPPGYAASAWSCAGGGTQTGNQIGLRLAEIATCTITNDDIPPSLRLVKQVVNDNGGTAAAGDWTLSAAGPTPISGAGGTTSGAGFSAGTYTLSESGPSGYTASAWTCAGGTQSGSQITLGLGEGATCTIVNNDNAPSGQISALVVAADNSPPLAELMATGRFSRVDYFDARTGSPTLSMLTGYSVVLAYTNFIPANATTLGNVLADYVDSGGGLALSTYAFSTPWSIQGRITTSGYSPLLNVGQNGDVSGALSAVVPGDRVFEGINLGTLSYFHNSNFAHPAVAAGATLLATDGAGRNLIARSSSSRVIGLNLFPSSFGGNQEFFRLLANAISSVAPPSMLTASFFGGPGDQRGSNIHRDGSDLYVSGTSGNRALLLRYGIPLDSPTWTAMLPPDTYFEGLTLSGSGANSPIGNRSIQAVTELNGALYLAGQSNLRAEDGFRSFARPVLMKYDTVLSRQWKRRPADYPAGEFLGVASLASHVYAVGYQ